MGADVVEGRYIFSLKVFTGKPERTDVMPSSSSCYVCELELGATGPTWIITSHEYFRSPSTLILQLSAESLWAGDPGI